MTKPSQSADGNGFRTTWDTSLVAEKDRFSYFREGICEAFLSFSPEPPSNGKLDARIETAVLPRGIISRVAATPHKAKRTKQDMSNIDGEYLSLDLQLAGGIVGEVGGANFAQYAGDVSLIRTNKISSFTLDNAHRYSMTAVIFEKSIFDRSPHIDDQYRIDNCYHKPITSCLRLISERYGVATQLEMCHLFDSVVALLNASLIDEQDYLQAKCDAESNVGAGLLQTIKRFSREHIANPTLSSTAVAEHFGISARYVQKLFATEGTTFKSYLIMARLNRIRADLTDPSIAHIAIGEIAFRWGFRDITTFYRNFKLQFGDTPTQTRLLIRTVRFGLTAQTRGHG